MSLVGLVRLIVCILLLVLPVNCQLQNTCVGQLPDFSDPPATTRPRNTQPASPRAKPKQNVRPRAVKKNKFPNPEVVTLDTKDGVTLTCTWFGPEGSASSQGGKAATQGSTVSAAGRATAPFILVHDWDQSRQDLLFLGRFLQLSGHAVIVPDLRGHGESLTVVGSAKPIDRNRFRKKEMATLMTDVEACKKFLMRKNDAGVLNIDLLSVVAVGKTATIAMQWAVSDWSWPPVGSTKQGQDVKSLILIAPEQKLSGVSMKPLLKHPLFVGGPNDPLPMLFVYSALHPESVEESTEIYDGIKKGRTRYAKAWRENMAEWKKINERQQMDEPAAAAGEGEEEEEAIVVPPPSPIDPMKTFVSGPVPRESKPGSELIASRESVGVFRFIDTFVKQAVLSRQAAYPWQKRLDK